MVHVLHDDGSTEDIDVIDIANWNGPYGRQAVSRIAGSEVEIAQRFLELTRPVRDARGQRELEQTALSSAPRTRIIDLGEP